jgi:DNA polymerase-1
MSLTLKDASDLMHRGAIALAEMEANGMRIDIAHLDATIAETEARIERLKEKLRECEEYRLQRRRFGQGTNLQSRDQLAAVLFGDMGHEAHAYTDSGKVQLDETALERIGTKYAKGFLRLEKLDKLLSTYLVGLRREVEGEFVHGFFGLHLVRSYRGQADTPNLTNVPVRDPIQGKPIRECFIPRDGHTIIERDFTGIEVRVACILSKDPKLTYDTLQGDMHRDMAAECFFLNKDNVSKPTRQSTKGGFVFAEFYGDWYKQVTKNLWDDVERYHLTTKEGVALATHLAAQGITERGACDPAQRVPTPGTFEAHIRKVEDRFWNERFKVYHAKRQAWIDEYKRQGYIDIVTGFRCGGPMSKNQVMNYHIQGPAFHCLLWTLIRLMAELKRRRMRTKVMCQIHDSIIADVPNEEVDEYLEISEDITSRQLPEAWPWLTIPLDAEVEGSTTNWWGKKPLNVAA